MITTEDPTLGWPTCARPACTRTSGGPARVHPDFAARNEGWCVDCVRARDREREEARRKATILRDARIPPRFAWASFDSPELAERADPAATVIARGWSGDRMALIGAAGVGKTSLAVAVFRAAVEQRARVRSAYFVSAFDLVKRGRGHGEELERFRAAEVLLLDDLGSEPSDKARTVSALLFARHEAMRTTIVTTWATPPKVAEIYGAGVARRVFEGALTLALRLEAAS